MRQLNATSDSKLDHLLLRTLLGQLVNLNLFDGSDISMLKRIIHH